MVHGLVYIPYYMFHVSSFVFYVSSFVVDGLWVMVYVLIHGLWFMIWGWGFMLYAP